MSGYAIEVKNLSKVYKLYEKPIDRLKESFGFKKYHREHHALDNVSFSIMKGETVGIIGVNGAGKSTLLKIITGVLTQTSGEININGKVAALLELGAGFNPEYTGIENIYLNGTMMGYSRDEMETKIAGILEFADIGEFVHQPVKTYSSGMFVRLAFAVSINVDPDILIVDEALSVGDVFFQLKCFKKIDEFRKKNKTIIFVSHDMGSISKYCSRCIMLSNGSKVADGNCKYVIDLYKKSVVGLLENDGLNDDLSSIPSNQSTRWCENYKKNSDTLEYGDDSAKIIDYGIFDDTGNLINIIEKGKYIYFKMKVQFKSEAINPIFAFSIKDVNGYEITGTNTLLEQVETGHYYKNDVAVVSFGHYFNLQGGPYFLSLGCTGFGTDGQLKVYHRLYDFMNLDIMTFKVSNGYVDLNSEIEIVKV